MKKHPLVVFGLVVAFFSLTPTCNTANAQQQTTILGTVDGGYPGVIRPVAVDSSGRLIVTGITGGGGSGGIADPAPVIIKQCGTAAHKVTSVGTSATTTPSTQLTNRYSITICNSLQNSGSPLVKCRWDGVSPVMALGNAGMVLGVGDCVTVPLLNTTAPSCIADTASTSITTDECGGV